MNLLHENFPIYGISELYSQVLAEFFRGVNFSQNFMCQNKVKELNL